MSVLQSMTKDIMSTKATKAARLTPVAGEEATTVSMAAVEAHLPNDLPGQYMSSEQLGEAARDLRKHAETLVAIADSIDVLIESTARRSPTVDPKKAAAAAQKAKEQAADAAARERDPLPEVTGIETVDADETESFKERLSRLSAEAQAATFKAADDSKGTPFNDLPHEVPAAGWACPIHGQKKLTTVKPRKGDPYLMCGVNDCEEFER